MTARRTMPAIAAAALAVGAVALAPGGAGGQEPPGGTCSQPYAPVYFDEVPASHDDTIDAPAIEAEELPLGPFRHDGVPDTDGDGVDDVVTTGTDTVTISRGDGDLVLTVAGTPEIHAGLVGDLDGDGRDEVYVRAGWIDPSAEAAPRPTDDAFLIPGTTATGAHAAADVGISFGADIVTLAAPPDGSGRLLAVHPYDIGVQAHTEVRDAAAVLALGPGGDTTTLPPDVRVELVPVATVDLGDPVPALLLAGTGSLNPGRMIIGVVRGTEVTRLTTDPETYYGQGLVADITVLDGPDGTYVRLDEHGRLGTGLYVWSLDDPCTALSAAESPEDPSGPSEAPPAEPIATDATFTG